MQAGPNGIHTPVTGGPSNGHDRMLVHGLDDAPSQEELENELPEVLEGQVSLGELLSRVAQAIYAELTEMADTLPNMSDSARKRTIADWVVKTKKQVVKLYAIMKWSRDARDVQKAMNITAFLMDQNRQFEESIQAVAGLKESLAPARLRNHDLLTSLDVLTSGTYLRLPTAIKKSFILPEPLTDAEVSKALRDMDFVMKYRLRMSEIVPCEMSRFVVEGGRTYFTVSNLFRVALSLRGAQKNDGWFFVNLEFLHDVDGEAEEVQDFPRVPTGDMKRHFTEEANARLNYYTPIPEDAPQPDFEPPARPQLPSGKVDAPLIRLYNFLQMMSLTYQLEILFFQASRLRSLGWREYLSLRRSPDGKSFVASYWIRPSQNDANRPPQSNFNRPRIPPIGGTLTVSLIETHASARAGGGPLRTPMHRILAELQKSSKISDAQPSDEVETFTLDVRWEPTPGALGVTIPPHLMLVQSQSLTINSKALNFEFLLQTAIRRHIDCILAVFQHNLLNGALRSAFASPGDVILTQDGVTTSLKVRLCADEVVVASIDTRTGKIMLRDVGELAAAGRGPRFSLYLERVNQNPLAIYECIVHLRYSTVLELVEQKAHYLGLQTFRNRNFSQQEYMRFGDGVRMLLFIQLAHSPTHYLVVVIAETEFRFALISTQVIPESLSSNTIMEDIGWLDVTRIHDDRASSDQRTKIDASINGMGGFNPFFAAEQFKLDTGLLRELYAYCCARVAYTKVELQLKLRGIPCTYLEAIPSNTSDLSSLQSSLSKSVPGLCVQSSDILAGAPAAEAAMPNIRVIPLNWWSTKKSQVVTCVKLKYVQQPVGKRAGTSTVIRPSKRIIYDTREAVVSFLSESVDSCVDEFLEEWAKVSKIVVIAREVAQMSRRASWDDVRLLSFDLQTVEFTYAQDYTVAITCTDQLLASSSSSYDLAFSRVPQKKRLRLDVDPFTTSEDNDDAMDNPHEDSEPFLRHVLRQGPRLSSSLHQLVLLLRNTLPVVCILDSIRKAAVSGRDKDAQLLGVDTFAKAAGWFRILYGDMRHALDFRLLSGRRVAVIDAAYTSRPKVLDRLTPFIPGHKPKPSVGGADSASKKHVTFANSDDAAKESETKFVNTIGLLQPIPDLANLIREAAQDVVNSNVASANVPLLPSTSPGSRPFTGRQVALLDMGVVCSVDDVDVLTLRIHSRIVRSLLKSKSDVDSGSSLDTSTGSGGPGTSNAS